MPPQFSTSFGARFLCLFDLVAEDPLESFSDSFWWSGFKNFPAGQAEAEQVREAARPREDHVVGQPQCFRRQILWELPMSCQAWISSLTLYAVQRGNFIWQQRDLRPCDSDFETVFRAVGPRAAVRLDGDDIRAELRSVSIVALEEAVGCVRDFQVEPLRHVLQDNTTCLSHGLPIRNLWFVWVQFDPEQLADSASDVLWRQQIFLRHHVHADVDGQEACEFLHVGQIWLCDDA